MKIKDFIKNIETENKDKCFFAVTVNLAFVLMLFTTFVEVVVRDCKNKDMVIIDILVTLIMALGSVVGIKLVKESIQDIKSRMIDTKNAGNIKSKIEQQIKNKNQQR